MAQPTLTITPPPPPMTDPIRAALERLIEAAERVADVDPIAALGLAAALADLDAARAALAAAPDAITEDSSAVAPPAPAEEEVADLHRVANALSDEGLIAFAHTCRSAATLLEQLSAAAPAVVPVPVSERPILKSNPFNDAEGRCWCGTAAFADSIGDLTVEHPPSWELRMPQPEDDCVVAAHALPLPASQGGEGQP